MKKFFLVIALSLAVSFAYASDLFLLSENRVVDYKLTADGKYLVYLGDPQKPVTCLTLSIREPKKDSEVKVITDCADGFTVSPDSTKVLYSVPRYYEHNPTALSELRVFDIQL